MDPPGGDDSASPPVQTETATLHPEPPQASPPSVSPTRIPKKTQPPIDGIPGLSPPVSLSQNGARSNSFDDGGSNDPPLSLPDGVQLPPTVTPGMIDGRLRRAFFDLTPAQMRDVLTEYDDAVKEKGGEIRNRTASIGRANYTTPPGPRPQRHHNQRWYVGVGAGTAGGWRGDFVYRRGF